MTKILLIIDGWEINVDINNVNSLDSKSNGVLDYHIMIVVILLMIEIALL